jgi:hypothetical protein
MDALVARSSTGQDALYSRNSTGSPLKTPKAAAVNGFLHRQRKNGWRRSVCADRCPFWRYAE